MYKIIALIRKNPEMNAEEFRRYWQDVHVPMIKERLPGLTKYIGSFPVPMGDVVAPDVQSDVDLIVELGFPDRQTMVDNMNGAAFLADDRAVSSARLMDLANTRAIVTEEVDVL